MLAPSDLAALRRQARWSAAFAYPVYVWLLIVGRLRYHYRIKDLRALRRAIWKELDAHEGPVIWAANHLTLIDSFLIFWAVFPFRRAGQADRVPWSTPEYRNYYHLGGFFKKRVVRVLMYLCRCIPFLREGDDEASVRWRETAFSKLIEVLRGGGTVFVYPEAGRSRSGWFDRRRPKDFLGRLALEVPNSKFLTVYMRGDSQLYTEVRPKDGELFRVEWRLVPAVLPGETTARQISQRLFDTIAELQELWWRECPHPKNCGGNDVVDLGAPLCREDFSQDLREADPEFLERHLTVKEQAYLKEQGPEKLFRSFWSFFAAKEACHKALAQSGIVIPRGGYRELEIDLFRRKALHRPTGVHLEIGFTPEEGDALHCLAVLRGGSLGDEHNPGDVLWRVETLPAGETPSEWARERCLEFIAESSDDIGSAASLAFSELGGIPRLLRAGKLQDWGVSISHSGRYIAYSFMIS